MLAGDVKRANDIGLWLGRAGADVTVDRLPGSAAYPRPFASTRLFSLAPGQVGRYRANFRFTGCACDPSWYYEDWLIHVSNGHVTNDRFLHGQPDSEVDHRVHLYGGTGRPHVAVCEPGNAAPIDKPRLCRQVLGTTQAMPSCNRAVERMRSAAHPDALLAPVGSGRPLLPMVVRSGLDPAAIGPRLDTAGRTTAASTGQLPPT
jgi:hypothetical protein